MQYTSTHIKHHNLPKYLTLRSEICLPFPYKLHAILSLQKMVFCRELKLSDQCGTDGLEIVVAHINFVYNAFVVTALGS